MKKRIAFALGLALGLALLAPPAAQAQEGEQEGKGVEQTEPGLIQITPKEGGWDIIELFRTISEYTGQSIVYDPNAPQIRGKKITFEGVQTVPRDRLFEWFQSLLSFQRIILVPVGPTGHEQWMALDTNAPQIMNRPIFVPEEEIEQWADRDGVYIVSTITVKNLTDTSRARNALAQLSTRQIGRINDVPGNLAFVVGDFAPVVASMYRLLRAMDVQPVEYEQEGRIYRLQWTSAEELEPILEDLLAMQQQQRQVVRGRPQGVPSKPEPRLIADTRQDAIIVYAVPEDHARIKEIIELLDQEVHYKRGNIHVIPVLNVNAPELADLLSDLISGTGGVRAPGRRPTPRRPGAPASPGTLTGAAKQPVIVAADRTNSLIIDANRSQFEELAEIIKELDVPRDQVLVEAALIELTIDDLVRFGVEMVSALRQDNPNERTPFAVSLTGLSTLTDTDGDGIPDINIPNVGGNGLTAGIFDNSRFPLIMQALSTNSKARALSLPSIVVEDGHDAHVTVGNQVPYQVRSTRTDGGVDFSVEFTDAEITLDISPHISSDNYLRLYIKQTVQSFGPQTSQDLPPPKTSREIETDVVIPDGYTVVLGGLINESSQQASDGIPLLKDIPWLGYLFQSQRHSKSATSLFLFVTPRILKNADRDFADYHKVTWERKMLAEKLLEQAIDIHNTRFKGAEDAEKKDRLDQIQDSGFLDHPRWKSTSRGRLSVEEARKRLEQIRAAKAAEGAAPAAGKEAGK